MAQVMLSLYELDGTPNDLDPRHVLQRVLDRYAADGLTPVAACELEYYLVDTERTADGDLQPPKSLQTGRAPRHRGLWPARAGGDLAVPARAVGHRRRHRRAAGRGDLGVRPSQVELTLKHKPDALRACDDALLYKRMAKGVALRHGCEATFMAKPWADRAGNGFHVHVSFNDADGNNLCADEDPEGSPMLRQAIGGMKQLLGEGMAILAPNANSYRRFKANSYAPVAATWGVNNRTVSLRIPAGPAPTRHVEHRVAGADGNPYLVMAVLLASAHHGLTNKIDPGPAVVGDGYAAAAKEKSRLPSNWFAAVDLFDQSKVLRDYLGDRFVDMFVSVKRTEQARFFEVVTEPRFRLVPAQRLTTMRGNGLS
jgi:glutamine synthetase